MVNRLNIKKIVERTPERPERPPQQPQNPDETQPPKVTIPLKYLSNFWRFMDLPLINSEIELD